MARARRDFDALVNEADTVPDADEIVAMSARAEGFLICPTERLDADVVARLDPRLRIVATHSVGFDHCDLPALAARGITLTNTPGVLSQATAEIALLLMLGAARRAVEGDRLVRRGEWTQPWSPRFLLGREVSGARLGIVGMGGVGGAFARMARGLGMQVHYHNRRRLPPGAEAGATYHETLETLLPVADFLSLHCPTTEETRDMIDAATLARLPAGAILVNTARGALVDEDALMAALDAGHLAAAGLDCFREEPGGNPRLAAYDNVFMLPHLGSATGRTRDAMGARALDNLDAFFAGQTPPDAL